MNTNFPVGREGDGESILGEGNEDWASFESKIEGDLLHSWTQFTEDHKIFFFFFTKGIQSIPESQLFLAMSCISHWKMKKKQD